MVDPIWIWPSGGLAVFSRQSAWLRLTVASQLYKGHPVFNLYLFCCYTTLFLCTGVLASTSDCFIDVKDTISRPQINSTDIRVGVKLESGLSTNIDEVENSISLMFPGDN